MDRVTEFEDGRPQWRAPTMRLVGRLSELVLGGEGKLTALTGDPGEAGKKPPSQPG